MYFRKKTSGGRAYLQIVESRRDGAQVRQQVIATLGRIEDLRDSGQLERLLRSGARFAAKAIVVNAVAEGTITATAARRIGPALVFERLWEETGCRKVIEDVSGSRKHGFPLERAVFLTARLCCTDPFLNSRWHSEIKYPDHPLACAIECACEAFAEPTA